VNNEKETYKYIVDIYSYFNPSDVFIRGGRKDSQGILPNGSISFKVNPISLEEENNTWQTDTLIFEWNKTSLNNEQVHEFQYDLSLDQSITVDQLIKFANSLNIGSTKLNEHLYWLCQLSNSRLVEKKNKYGDVEGYYAIASNGEYVPPDYFYVNKSYGLSVTDKYYLHAYAIKILEDETNKNSIWIFAHLNNYAGKGKGNVNFAPNGIFEPLGIDLNLNRSRFDKIINPNCNIKLTVHVKSEISFNKNGTINGAYVYSPFDIGELKQNK
jgi:hypothetical protein